MKNITYKIFCSCLFIMRRYYTDVIRFLLIGSVQATRKLLALPPSKMPSNIGYIVHLIYSEKDEVFSLQHWNVCTHWCIQACINVFSRSFQLEYTTIFFTSANFTFFVSKHICPYNTDFNKENWSDIVNLMSSTLVFFLKIGLVYKSPAYYTVIYEVWSKEEINSKRKQ